VVREESDSSSHCLSHNGQKCPAVGSCRSEAVPRKQYTCLLVAFVIASLANAWPFLLHQYVPFMDHPSHLFKANVIRHFSDPQLRYFESFQINNIPAPNLLNDYLVAVIASVLDIDLAARFMASLSVVLLPICVFFWIRCASPGRESWAVLALPMAWSRFLLYGNENFCLASCMLFLFWGLLATWHGRFRLPVIWTCALLAVAMYLAHFLVFLLAGLGVLVHVLVTSPRCPRVWAAHAAILVPPSVLACIWFFCGGGSSLSPVHWDFSLISKLRAMAGGISPWPWRGLTSATWCIAFAAAGIVFIMYRAVVEWKRGRHFPAALCISCMAPALLLSRWFFIFIPDQRIWWITVLASFALLPSLKRSGTALLCAFGVFIATGTSIEVFKDFGRADANLSRAEKAFSTFPRNLRLAYIGEPALAVELHRCFEYYHIRYGGIGPHHLVGREQSVRYRTERPPFVDIYSYGPRALGRWLDAYDGVLIIGRPSTPGTEDMLHALQKNGYRLHSPPPFALLLHPQYTGDTNTSGR